jgi:two-component system LytT family response regulator
MYPAIIIDDEVSSVNYLQGLIQTHLQVIELKGSANNIDEGIALIQKVQPKIVFLDIELHSTTGFNLLSQLEKIDFQVIFTTAHEHYALKAIKFAALDFLLKPVDEDELKIAVNRAVTHFKEKTFDTNMSVFIENLRNTPEQKKIAISTATSIIVIEIDTIYYLQSDGPYTKFFAKNNPEIISSKHLKEYEDLLVDFGFFRVHRSYLINLGEIKQYVKSDGGYVIMSNGDRVDVSDKKKAELITRLSSQVIFIR